ncbi:16S rRNA (guanine527-N7)-methyltransferase [Desulfobotulus alkaliphilus]|uniref:Ribosomal RNA small subunit methyltransferase G n=1 Tax=Desulfobotulus alkaliphilus TaxID=622671 RepID=A0A562RPA7_9BACT|nr:16S rRNA (guanine(527)-N(7))-methyltransferase RsmG [Desulfobotulus alkaliphilus]TWI70753.1 16S rRNA (guanine527-N7)-methyltransferase [Desulfobotulus alkaliphilus]
MQAGDSLWCEKVKEGAALMGLYPAPEVLEGLALHVRNLILWNKKINLTAITDPLEVAEKHVLDSLTLTAHLPAGGRVLDMGSGGGFPGLVMALMRPDLDVLMVDSVQKKMVFVQDVIRSLKLANASALHTRVESLDAGDFSCVVSRAFTSLERFVSLSLPFLASSGSIIAMKGPDGRDETAAAAPMFPELAMECRTYGLPFGGGERSLVLIRRREAMPSLTASGKMA